MKDVTAADILYALDQAISEAREQSVACGDMGKAFESEFFENVRAGLAAFREHLRSQEFLVSCQKEKGER